ncbi:MAG: dUTP diphosphatase [Paracoccaceae bacterium]
MTVLCRWIDGADTALGLPDYATAGAAGADIRAHLPAGPVVIAPMGRTLIPTGLRMAVPDGFELQIRGRSGLALRHGIVPANGVGTVDSDYRGEVGVILANLGAEPFEVAHGMRIAQGVVAPAPRTPFALGDPGATSRGAGGWGSTGTG